MWVIILLIACLVLLLLFLIKTNTTKESFVELPKVAIAVQMRKPIDLPLWLDLHRKLGIKMFFIRIEDTPSWESFLKTQPDVIYEFGKSDHGNNYETVVDRQVEWVNTSLAKAHDMGIEWVINIDADELLHGTLDVLFELDANYMCIKLENMEAIYDGNETHCFDAKQFLKCGANAPCRAYVNGKGGGRAKKHVQSVGAHDFAFNGVIEGDHLYKIPREKLCVLHFDSCSFGSWAEKFVHLAKGQQDNIPFDYYKSSISSIKQAYDVYTQHTHHNISEIDQNMVYKRV